MSELFTLSDEKKLRNIKEFSDTIRSGIFSSKKTPKEAVTYAYDIINILSVSDRSIAYTALHVVLNSIADEIDRLIK